MEKQLTGQRVSLQMNSPLEYRQHPGDTGQPLMQTGGADKAPISHTAYDLNPINAGTGQPVFQSTSSSVPLDKTPMKGWQSFPTPMSTRTVKASK